MGVGTLAGCGGLLRDFDGRWIKGYTKKIGLCDTFYAELWGMYMSLDIVWRENVTHLIVESDAKILVDMITDSYVGSTYSKVFELELDCPS